jgi:hypothetical protein
VYSNKERESVRKVERGKREKSEKEREREINRKRGGERGIKGGTT